MKKRVKKKRALSDILSHWKKITMFIVTFIVIYLTLVTAVITKKYDFNVGDIPNVDVKANREIVDEVATEARKKEVVDKVDKQYTLKTEIQKQGEDAIKAFFSKAGEIRASELKPGEETEEQLNELTKLNVFYLNSDEIKTVLALTKDEIYDLEKILLQAFSKSYEASIGEDKPEELQRAKDSLKNSILDSNLSKNNTNILIKMGNSLIKPNFFYDKEKTDELIKDNVKDVSPIVIKKNQIIIKEGEPVTEHQLELLGDLGLLNDSKFDFYVYIALAGLVIVILYLQYNYVHRHYKNVYNDFSKLVLISILNVASVILARVIGAIYPFLIPLSCVPILLTLLIDYKVSLVLSLLNIILISGAVGFNSSIIILAVLSAILGSTSFRKMHQRNDILYSTIIIGILNGIATLCVTTLVTNNLIDILISTALSICGALLSGVLAVGLLPFFESTFDIVTTVKLLELSNPNNPLLKKLLMEAPGTYHHSVLVANLVELAAEEVGGNPLLARIGAYYHDVGKTKRPYFFKENQIGKENPHDKISANLSTLIITSHVKDGLELAKEYNVPKTIQDFIATHHGDTLVKYFYFTAKNNAENSDEVKEEDFMYPGPRPQSKEQGILMLADSVEAAVRSINDPTKGKIEEMVNNIVKDKLNSGQLDQCDLTFKDIDKIKKCFLKALSGIYHQRIEYPTENKKKEQK